MQSVSFRAFIRAIVSSWFTGMSGPLSVPLAIAAIFVSANVLRACLGVTALVCFWSSAYGVWAREREARNAKETEAARLAARLSPQMVISLKNDGISIIPMADGSLSKWVQFSVQSITQAPLAECEAWVTDITRLNSDGSDFVSLVEEPVRCIWSQRPPAENLRATIPPGLQQYANIFSLNDRIEEEIKLEVSPSKIRLYTEIQTSGIYRIKVLISANDAPSVTRNYIFKWRNFDNIILEEDRISA